jgi:hypothetical protein
MKNLRSAMRSVNMPSHKQRFGFFLKTFIATTLCTEAKMKIKDILAVVVGIASALGAIFYFYKFVTTEAGGSHSNGWISLGLAAVAFVCGLLYFLGHVNKEEEIHITQ